VKLYNDNKKIVDDKLISQLNDYLTTDKGYVLRESKGKSVVELGLNADRIRKKWHLGKDKDDLVALLVKTVLNDGLGALGGLYNEVNMSFYGDTPNTEMIKEGIGQLSVLEFGEDVPYYIDPSVCVKKALWPFLELRDYGDRITTGLR
jgi:hypothetical protein